MNLKKLFQIQKQLDDRIVKEHGLEGQDLLDKKILALQVELGELANEWRGFKFWSKDQEPRTELFTTSPLPNEPLVVKRNPLLEEYVDCLHFILSIGIELNATNVVIDSDYTKEIAVKTFIKLFDDITMLLTDLETDIFQEHVRPDYEELFNTFFGLGEKHLGFSWEQIEQAYLDKNKINHERQANNY